MSDEPEAQQDTESPEAEASRQQAEELHQQIVEEHGSLQEAIERARREARGL